MLLRTYYGLENFKYFWLISIDAYKVKSSIFISEKLNNLSKITQQKLSKTVFVFQSIFNLLFHPISQAKGEHLKQTF